MVDKKSLKLQLNEQLNEIENLRTGELFTDQYFKPDASCIFNSITINNKIKRPMYVFLRLSEMEEYENLNILELPKEFELNPDILTEDVIQGQLGDCYLLSSLSAFAEYHERMKNLFVEPKLNPKGYIKVKIYLHGIPEIILIDDYFPCLKFEVDYYLKNKIKPSISCLAFASVNRKTLNIWPILLEKVWAKVNACYDNIVSGICSEVFEFFSPGPFSSYFHDIHKDQLFQHISDSDNSKFVICCDISDASSKNFDKVKQSGLVTNHAYSLIDAAVVNDHGTQVQILKIRNPWGNYEWSGDWSDKSKKWTPELSKKYNVTDINDGTFWISLNDYVNFYSTTHICHMHDNYEFVFKKFKYKVNSTESLIKLTLKEETKGYLILNMKNTRIYKHFKGLENFENSYVSVHLFQVSTDNRIIDLGSSGGRRSRHYIQFDNLKAGEYYVLVLFPQKCENLKQNRIHFDFEHHKLDHTEIHKQEESFHDSKHDPAVNVIEDKHDGHAHHNVDTEVNNFTLGLYASVKTVEFKKLKNMESLSDQYLVEMVKSMARSSKNKIELSSTEKSVFKVVDFQQDIGPYGFIYYENNSELIIIEKYTFSSLFGCSIMPAIQNIDVSLYEQKLIEATMNNPDYGLYASHKNEESSVVKMLYSETLALFFNQGTLILSKNGYDNEKLVNEENKLEFEVRILPNCSGFLLLQKYEESAKVDFISTNFKPYYPLLIQLNECKFKESTTRRKIVYNNEYAELYEVVTESESGMIIKLRNQTNSEFTKPLSIRAFIKAESMSNENINPICGIKENSSYKLEQIKKSKVIKLAPGEVSILLYQKEDNHKKYKLFTKVDWTFDS